MAPPVFFLPPAAKTVAPFRDLVYCMAFGEYPSAAAWCMIIVSRIQHLHRCAMRIDSGMEIQQTKGEP